MPYESLEQLIGVHSVEEGDGLGSLRDRFPFRPTLFVGLGGTGCQAVSKVKSLYERLLQPKLTEGMKGVDPEEIDGRYAFLAFDSDDNARPLNLRVNRDWYHIGVGDLGGFYQGLGQRPEFNAWVLKDYPATSLISGCAGTRNLGRLAFVYNVGRVSAALDAKLTQIQRNAAQPDTVANTPVVFVFGSFSGGTGSGGLLDLSFLLREKLKTVGSSKIVGLLAVLDGLSGMIPLKKQAAQANTFGGLKELDAFMSGRTPGVAFNAPIDYPGGHRGWVYHPYDECFLLSPTRDDGSRNLPTQAHVTSFLARYAFMISAYSFRGEGRGGAAETPDYHGVMINHGDMLVKEVGGVRTCYLVPGMAQVHFPTDQVADAFVLSAARRYLTHLKDAGDPSIGVEAARRLSNESGLSAASLKALFGNHLQRASAPEARRRTYSQTIVDLLKDESRYERAEEILTFGETTLAHRQTELTNVLRPYAQNLTASLTERIRGKLDQLIGRSDGLMAAGRSFLAELAVHVNRETAELAERRRQSLTPLHDDLVDEWRRVKPMVEDVVQDSGLLDRMQDRWRLEPVAGAYAEFLNNGEAYAHDAAHLEASSQILREIRDLIEEMSNRLHDLVDVEFFAAGKRIRTWEDETNLILYRQEKGSDDSVDDVCSVNLLQQEWRDAFEEHLGMGPTSTHQALIEAGHHPRFLFDLGGSDGEAGLTLARQLVVWIDEVRFREVRQWSPHRILVEGTHTNGRDPVEVLGDVVNTTLRPQMRLSNMMNRVGQEPTALFFTGGIDPDLRDELVAKDVLDPNRLKLADNQETYRINFFSTSLPVALAGCDILETTFEPAYERWREEVSDSGGSRSEKENRLREFHCFPGSWNWKSPTHVRTGVDEDLELFAKAFAVSLMLEVSEADRQKMRKLRRARNLRYGLSQVSGSHFWSWPFFPPAPEGFTGGNQEDWRVSEEGGKPVRLGSNVREAYQRFQKDSSLKATSRLWLEWFRENWNVIYKAGAEIGQKREAAIAAMEEKKGRTVDSREVDTWDAMIEIVRTWEV